MNRIVAGMLAALLAAGLAAPAARAENVVAEFRAVQQDGAFNTWLKALLAEVQADPEYRRLPLDSDAQTEEFEVKLHETYRGVMSKAEFARWVDAKYPGHAYEVGVITSALPK